MDQKNKSHPALIYFGSKTLSRDFPLVVFVGREPQTDEAVSKGIGPYNFTKHPRCAFWNTAYSQFARSDVRGDYRGADLKRECLQADASPIVFADALPICLSDTNSTGRKVSEREAVSKAAIDEHIDGIIGLDLFERVSLVVLAGHGRREFSYATEAFQRRLDAKCIPHVSTAFLYPTNSRKIRSQIAETGADRRFRSILAAFRDRVRRKSLIEFKGCLDG